MDNVKLYVVKDPGNLPMSFAWDPENVTEIGTDGYTKTLEDGKIVLNINNKVDPLNPNKPDVIVGNSVLVARYEGKFKNDAFDDAATRVTFDNGTPAKADNFFWDNIIYTTDADASGTGDEEVGYFEDYHVYQTINADGTITTDGFDFVAQQQGHESEKYTTVRKDREGYELVSVESPDGAKFNKDGAKTTGNFVNGKTLHVKYVYQKRPVEKTYALGDRVWIDDNKDGLQTEGEKGVEGVTVKLTGGDLTEAKTTKTDANGNYKFEGLKNGEYKVTFEVPEGYEITKTNVGTDDEKDSDGTEVTATIKDADNISVDLGLVKKETPTEKKGSFQEHHVYEVYKDGKLIESSEITLEETTGTEEEYFTTSAKPNGTKDQPKEGFKLVKELIAKSIDVESHLTGEEIKEHYKNNEKLEVRYVYRKDITTPTTPEIPWTPLEPSEPVTPVEPEEPTTPVVPDQPEEPATPVEPETPGEDPKETPWTPLTPAEEVTPQNPDDNETPKEDPKETPKEDSKETPKEDSKETSEKQSKKLPKAGADYELLKLAAGALSIVSGLGLSLGRKKED